jgi:glyoxylase-like metal-dependent hydrolase (beta-lactamase superfamily II)
VDNFVNTNNLEVLGIILTHAHYDHIGYGFEFAKKYNCKIYVNKKEKQVLLKYHLADKFNIDFYIDESLIEYFEEPIFTIGKFTFDIKTFPGHTEGSTILKYKDYVFTGDVVFYDSIGRTDLPTGNDKQMQESLKSFLNTYHDND